MPNLLGQQPTPVAADVSRRCLRDERSAPTDVGGYALVRNIAAAILGIGLLTAIPAVQAADQYFLLNTSASSSYSSQSSPSNVMAYVQQKFGAGNAASSLKVGVAVIYYPGGASGIQGTLTLLTNDLAIAKRLNIPILLQVDVENALSTSLLNWYDPALPGYDTNKTADVEWYGWSLTNAVKLCWRNWGTQLRVGPQPNLLSPNFQAWEKSVYTNLIPNVLQWYNSLSVTQKWLFVGWKCGWETSLNSQYFYYSNGNSYYSQPPANDPTWGSPKQTLGYNAAQTAGLKTNGVLDFGASDYDLGMKIIGKHLTYLASLAYSNGVPRGKIFLHSIAEGVDQYNTDKLLNPYANPGATCYPSSNIYALKYNASFMKTVHTSDGIYNGTGYGYGEFNQWNVNKTNYSVWFDWFTNNLHGDPDCIYQALYNSDTMRGNTNLEEAMLDAMALFPQTYDLTYNGNGSTVGIPPADTNSPYSPGATVTLLGNGKLGRTGYAFTGWNTATNGSGTGYSAGNTFTVLTHTTLYAQWAPPIITGSVTGPKLVLNWPAGQDFQLQGQTNNPGMGLGTNWSTLTNATPPYTNTINPANSSVFHRLIQPAGALGTNFVIYKDALMSGWTMNGFSSTYDTANPSPVHSGTASIALTLQAGGGRGPYGPSTSTTNYTFLSFWIHGGSAGGQLLTLQALRAGNIAETWYIPYVLANTWVNYTLPLGLLKLASVPDFNGIRFVNNISGQDAPVFYVDDIQLQP